MTTQTIQLAIQLAIQSNRYVATPAQLEQLALAVLEGQESAGLYLQTLIAAAQAILRRPKRAGTQTAIDPLAAIETAYKPSYAAVQRGVARGETLTPKQLASRCGFARTSASALRKYVETGGDLLALKPGEVSRRMLRPEGPAIPAGTTRAERTMLLSISRITRAAERAAEKDAAAGRLLLEHAVEALSSALDAMADGNQHDVQVVAHRLQRSTPSQVGAR